MSGSVKARVTLPNLTDAIDSATVETLHKMSVASIKVSSEIWQGFNYSGNYPQEQMGTSQEGWQATTIFKEEEGYSYGFKLFNDAQIQARVGTYEPKYWGRKSGKSVGYKNSNVGDEYAAFVQKSGHTAPLWLAVLDRIESDLVPAIEIELLKNIEEAALSGADTVELRADDESIGTFNFNL